MLSGLRGLTWGPMEGSMQGVAVRRDVCGLHRKPHAAIQFDLSIALVAAETCDICLGLLRSKAAAAAQAAYSEGGNRKGPSALHGGSC